MPSSASSSAAGLRPLRVGFVPLTDAAPLVVAEARGFFTRHGLRVKLTREVGWATVRDKLFQGELDAAPVPAPMLWAAQLGLGSAAFPVCTAFVLNLNGNAITVSTALRAAGVTNAAALRTEALRRRGERRLTFGIVHPFSYHHLLLRSWLKAGNMEPDRDVRIAVVPPAQMFRNLVAGTIDGYCVGEPWNSVAVAAKAGWCPTWSAAQAPGHLEKVLMVRVNFAEKRPKEHAALVAALAGAAAWCDEPGNRAELAGLLAAPRCLNLPLNVIAPVLAGRFDDGAGRVESVPDFHVFHRGDANLPSSARAAVLQKNLVTAGLIAKAAATAALPAQLFRADLYRQAVPE
jgi:ABC-type nitrate/sulfonate/bicarbonate transport system substrate-binding protein